MCGIAGFICFGKVSVDLSCVLREMTDSLIHRGPDDAGYDLRIISTKNGSLQFGFGHRRLTIIDLSARSHQPMISASGDLILTYNGEIYNYVELRDELRQFGYEFETVGDTEVVLKAYEAWGTECFTRFNGMWALAIYDRRRRKLVLSRDRFGKKPLYYWKSATAFVFGSEIKAILKYPGIPKEPNYERVYRYIATNYRYLDIDESSYFQDINQVPKSCFLEVDEDFDTKVNVYWNLKGPKQAIELADQKAVEEFRSLFIDAIRLRLRSDVPVGCMLSGGMDSTSITSVAYKVLKTPIITFSGVTGAQKGVYDESEYINAVIRETNAVFHYVSPDPIDIFDTVNEMLSYHDEPLCTVTWYSLYLIAKKIRGEGVPVILNGHGGDELLAGYWDHYHYYFYDLLKAGKTVDLDREISAWWKNHNRDVTEIDRTRDYIRRLERGETVEVSRFPDYSDCFLADFALRHRRNIAWENPMNTFLDRRLYSEMLYETIPASLRPEDRNTMSQSLESRSPFLDYRLVEYCFGLAGNLKIRNGLGKWILREAMKGILPETVRTRKDKAGFIAPADEWFRTVNREQLYALIESSSFRGRGIFNVHRIRDVFEEHLKNEKNHYMFFWQLINIELWFRKFFD